MKKKRCFFFISQMSKQRSEYGYFVTNFYGYHEGSIRIPDDKYLVVRLKMLRYNMTAGIEKIISVRELYRMPARILKGYIKTTADIMNDDAKRELDKLEQGKYNDRHNLH